MRDVTKTLGLSQYGRRLTKALTRPLSQTWVVRSRLVSDLQQLGIHRGQILLVHASLSAIGYVPGGPRSVIGSLCDVVGLHGTLVMPTHSWDQVSAGLRTFDARYTESCVGAVAEHFRRMPGVVRSLHPTHSVAALGPLAPMLVKGHERCEAPCGEGSPYAKILERDGKLLFLGVGLERNTCFHTVEALAAVPYLLRRQPDEFTIVDASGKTKNASIVRHQARIPRRFTEMEQFLYECEALHRGRVGCARSLLVAGCKMRDTLVTRLRQEPDFLLSDTAVRRPQFDGDRRGGDPATGEVDSTACVRGL